jgi:predicted ATP-grasp superfamily ATP-dependent carboligase
MVRILIYEFLTGGGAWHWRTEQTAPSLLAEGRAMVLALCSDFLALPGLQVLTTRDSRLPPLHPDGCQVTEVMNAEGELAMLSYLASQADWTLLVAPETGGALAQRAGLVELAGGRLLSPGTKTIAIAANKQTTMDHLGRRHFPVPRGELLTADAAALAKIPFPAVLKPIDGCGSQGLQLLDSTAKLPTSLEPSRWRIEEFVPGMAASVAVLCGPREGYALPACEQRLSSDGRFTYRGGRFRLPAKLDGRARNLALATVQVLPPTVGYVGIDLVLGDADDGSGDRIIEINPRLTTSFVGLRAAALSNLAEARVRIADGDEATVEFSDRAIEFDSSGNVSFMR